MEAELKAAKLAEMKESDMADEDEDELAEPFDSNCITPGKSGSVNFVICSCAYLFCPQEHHLWHL